MKTNYTLAHGAIKGHHFEYGLMNEFVKEVPHGLLQSDKDGILLLVFHKKKCAMMDTTFKDGCLLLKFGLGSFWVVAIS